MRNREKWSNSGRVQLYRSEVRPELNGGSLAEFRYFLIALTRH